MINAEKPTQCRLFAYCQCCSIFNAAAKAVLDKCYLFGTGTLGTLTFNIGNSLTFTEFFEGSSFDVRTVEKHVLACASVNESKTLVSQTLDCTFRHYLKTLKS